MFDNKQSTDIDNIDKRFIPNEGLINIWSLASFMGYSPHYDRPKHDEYLNLLVEEFDSNNIPMIKIGPDKSRWIVRLEDIKPLRTDTNKTR